MSFTLMKPVCSCIKLEAPQFMPDVTNHVKGVNIYLLDNLDVKSVFVNGTYRVDIPRRRRGVSMGDVLDCSGKITTHGCLFTRRM